MFTRQLLCGLLLCGTTSAAALGGDVLGKTETGTPTLTAIDVIGFAPGGVLLIGDGRGGQILAVKTNDTTETKSISQKIENIQQRLAARIGAKSDGISMLDMAVNPASGRVYFAVRKQDDKQYIILRIDGGGNIDEFQLDNVTYARLVLPKGERAPVNYVTDLAWADDRILAGARANEEFASKLFVIKAPLEHEAEGAIYSAETYHVSHGRWETKAPMSAIIPFRENEQTFVVGAFSCTPVVKYPIDAIKPGASVKGISVLELGSGNRPLDMFSYEKDGKAFVLANTFRFHHERKPFGPSPYWTVRFEQGILQEHDNVNENALRRLGKNYTAVTERVTMVESMHGVTQMDKLNDEQVVLLRESDSGVDLEVAALP
jgi:hypothetical protein